MDLPSTLRLLLTEVARYLEAASSVGTGDDNLSVALEHNRGNERVGIAAKAGSDTASGSEGGIQFPGRGVARQCEGFEDRRSGNVPGLSRCNDIPVGLESKGQGPGKAGVWESRDVAAVASEKFGERNLGTDGTDPDFWREELGERPVWKL